jgi:hypothetical protein
VIVSAAFCPHPPVLVPAVAQGAGPELDDLRAACIEAITRIAAPGRRLAVLGAGPRTRRHAANARGSFAGFGVPVEVGFGDGTGPVELPLSLTVGAWLVREALTEVDATGYSVSDATAPGELSDDVALLVMGDGSARRSIAAPGYLDDRAEGFDAEVVGALRSGEPARLAAVDPALGADLLAAGAPCWPAAAELLAGRSYRAAVSYDAAPYGVGYFVAVWT